MKPVFKISPSLLNQFASYMRGEYGATMQTVMDYVTAPKVTSAAMSRGTAVHSILEGVEKTANVFEPEMAVTWNFSEDAYAKISKYGDAFKDASHEIWDSLRFDIEGAGVYMRMRFDCLDGNELHEFKTTSRAKGYSDYYTSLQWRCYLEALQDVNKVRYHILEMPPADPAKEISKVKIYTIDYVREANNGQVLREYLNHFVQWILNEPILYSALVVNFDALRGQMSGIVQAALEQKISRAQAFEQLSRIASDLEELHPHFKTCLNQ